MNKCYMNLPASANKSSTRRPIIFRPVVQHFSVNHPTESLITSKLPLRSNWILFTYPKKIDFLARSSKSVALVG